MPGGKPVYNTRGLASLRFLFGKLSGAVELSKSEGSPQLQFELAHMLMLLEEITKAIESEMADIQTLKLDVIRAIYKAGKHGSQKPRT